MHAETLDGRYRVVREIARGGMGVVYLVEHEVTGKRHAAKVLMSPVAAHAGMVERFRREARSAARIGSRHVVDVTDAGTAPEMANAPFLVMELLSGLDLSHLVVRHGPLRPDEAIAILAPVSRVLERAHGMGIVHRDLKPANLYLHRDEDGRAMVKVLDFGLATAVRDAVEDRAVTATGDVMGTPAYMAPEQAAGHHAAVGSSTDLWALGLIAFELLSGQSYWGNASTGQVFAGLIRQQLHAPSQLTPHLGPAFDQWFARACHWDPALRFDGPTEQLETLARLLGVVVPDPDAALPPSLQRQVEAAYMAEPSPDTSRGSTIAARGEAPALTPAPGVTSGAYAPAPNPAGPQAGTAAPVIVASPSGGLPPRASGPSWSLIIGLFGAGVAIAAGIVAAVLLTRSDRQARAEREARVEAPDDEATPPPMPSLPFDLKDLINPQQKGPSLLWNPKGLEDELKARMADDSIVRVAVYPGYAFVDVRDPIGEQKSLARRTAQRFRYEGGSLARTSKPTTFAYRPSQVGYAFSPREIDLQQLPKMLAHVKTMTDQPVTHARFMRPLPKERAPTWRLHTKRDHFEFDAEGSFRRRSP